MTLALLRTFSKSHAADPDPLQDFCVADMSSNARPVNGYLCKPVNTVTAGDFKFTGFREPSKTKRQTSTPYINQTRVPINLVYRSIYRIDHNSIVAINAVFN